MKHFSSFLCVFFGAFLSGEAAGWGACLAGHDPGAGYPFPDFEGIVLFLFGVFVIPVVLAVAAAWVRRWIARRRPGFGFPLPVVILIIGPLVGLATGYAVQTKENREKEASRVFDEARGRACSRFAAQVSEDPEVVLRERWYAAVPPDAWTPEASARQHVFERSLDSEDFIVPYTSAQLERIYQLAPDARLRVVGHHACPPELIVESWSAVMESGQVYLIERVVKNPRTPRHLLENFLTERMRENGGRIGWLEEEAQKRLKQEP